MVEFIVSVGIFSVIVTIAIGGFIQALKTQRQVSALISANGTLSLVMEQMAREMRVGTDFCNGLPNAGCTVGDLWSAGRVVFQNSSGKTVIYCLDDASGSIQRGENVTLDACGSSGFRSITPSRVRVRHLSFYLYGNQAGDGRSTRITIVAGGSPRELGVSESFTNLQTSVTARNLDS